MRVSPPELLRKARRTRSKACSLHAPWHQHATCGRKRRLQLSQALLYTLAAAARHSPRARGLLRHLLTTAPSSARTVSHTVESRWPGQSCHGPHQGGQGWRVGSTQLFPTRSEHPNNAQERPLLTPHHAATAAFGTLTPAQSQVRAALRDLLVCSTPEVRKETTDRDESSTSTAAAGHCPGCG